MAKLILTVFISFFLTQVFGQLKPKGTFIGGVPMTDCCSPGKPQYKWYHLSELTFKGDSVYLEQSPIAIYKTTQYFQHQMVDFILMLENSEFIKDTHLQT
jgi:hypothetical protein